MGVKDWNVRMWRKLQNEIYTEKEITGRNKIGKYKKHEREENEKKS